MDVDQTLSHPIILTSLNNTNASMHAKNITENTSDDTAHEITSPKTLSKGKQNQTWSDEMEQNDESHD